MLQCAGVQLVPFSPLHDQQLPPGLSAVLLGGGAAVHWAEQLQSNSAVVEALRAFAAAGGLVMGEADGMMYLSRSIQHEGGQRRSMGELNALDAIEQLLGVGGVLSRGCTSVFDCFIHTHIHFSKHTVVIGSDTCVLWHHFSLCNGLTQHVWLSQSC